MLGKILQHNVLDLISALKYLHSIKKASIRFDFFKNTFQMPANLRKSGHSGGGPFSHIHSKTVGRGFESSCPCHKGLKRDVSGSFFLLCGGICSENAVKDGLDEPCRNMIASWFFCFEYFRLVQHQKSIREHPEHQFNHDAWGAFSMFTAYQFLIGETGGGDQRLKSLVMPLSLAVSFFT